MLHWWRLCAICVICHLLRDGYKTRHFFVEACWHGYFLAYWSHGNIIGDGGFSYALINNWNPIVWYQLFLMMSTLLIHMWSNNVAKQSHLSRGTCLNHICSKSAVWQSPLMRGICSDHIWSKFAEWQSPPMRGTFWATFGRSPLCDKVLQWGAHFGLHLVKVHCMTKASNEGHILGHIWLKSAEWHSPPTRGTFWATFGQSPLSDTVLQ